MSFGWYHWYTCMYLRQNQFAKFTSGDFRSRNKKLPCIVKLKLELTDLSVLGKNTEVLTGWGT